jgi:hypothetical protein
VDPVSPVVEIDLSRYRITADADAVAGLDSRPDLLQTDPYAFERLVRELFEAMGFETWLTQGSREDGVDAVAVKYEAGVAAVPAFEHANRPGTPGTEPLTRDSATGPPRMLSRLRGGPVFGY